MTRVSSSLKFRTSRRSWLGGHCSIGAASRRSDGWPTTSETTPISLSLPELSPATRPQQALIGREQVENCRLQRSLGGCDSTLRFDRLRENRGHLRARLARVPCPPRLFDDRSNAFEIRLDGGIKPVLEIS